MVIWELSGRTEKPTYRRRYVDNYRACNRVPISSSGVIHGCHLPGVFNVRGDILSLTSNRKVYRDIKRNHVCFKERRNSFNSLKQRFIETGGEGRGEQSILSLSSKKTRYL